LSAAIRQRVRAGSHDTLYANASRPPNSCKGDGIDVFFDLALVPGRIEGGHVVRFLFEQLFQLAFSAATSRLSACFVSDVELSSGHAWCPYMQMAFLAN